MTNDAAGPGGDWSSAMVGWLRLVPPQVWGKRRVARVGGQRSLRSAGAAWKGPGRGSLSAFPGCFWEEVVTHALR